MTNYLTTSGALFWGTRTDSAQTIGRCVKEVLGQVEKARYFPLALYRELTKNLYFSQHYSKEKFGAFFAKYERDFQLLYGKCSCEGLFKTIAKAYPDLITEDEQLFLFSLPFARLMLIVEEAIFYGLYEYQDVLYSIAYDFHAQLMKFEPQIRAKVNETKMVEVFASESKERQELERKFQRTRKLFSRFSKEKQLELQNNVRELNFKRGLEVQEKVSSLNFNKFPQLKQRLLQEKLLSIQNESQGARVCSDHYINFIEKEQQNLNQRAQSLVQKSVANFARFSKIREEGLKFRIKREGEKLKKIEADELLKLEAKISARRAIIGKIQDGNGRRAQAQANSLLEAMVIQFKKRLSRDFFKAVEKSAPQTKLAKKSDGVFADTSTISNRPLDSNTNNNFTSTAFQNFFSSNFSIVLLEEPELELLLNNLQHDFYVPKFDLRKGERRFSPVNARAEELGTKDFVKMKGLTENKKSNALRKTLKLAHLYDENLNLVSLN